MSHGLLPFAAVSRRLALLALVLLCAGLVPAVALIAPATAAAQSAGDEQYEDPFGNGNGGNGGSSGGGGTAQPQPTATPSQPTTAQPSAPPAATGTTASATSGAEQSGGLPRTGAPVALVALGGAVLLAGGLALRRHVRDEP